MCQECWDDYEPAPITPEIKNAVAWLCVLYEYNAAGGLLHVYVDDWNLPVPETMERWQWALTESDPHKVEIGCWEAMKTLTEQEQATALAIHRGFYRPDGASPITLPMDMWGNEPFWSDEVKEMRGTIVEEFWASLEE